MINDSENAELKLFIGTYTRNGSEGIYMANFNADKGVLSDKKLVAKTSNPSFLAIDQDQKMVYAANENDSGLVSSFRWNEEDQKLDLINQQPSYGAYPCYIDVNKTGDKLAVANYGTGNVAFYQISNGKLEDSATIRQHTGKGPNPNRQKGPHAHFSKFRPELNMIYTVDLGIDEVIAYTVNSGNFGEGFTALKLNGGDGPRHLAFHPEKNQAFVINELSSTIVSASINQETGEFEAIDRISTIPEDYEGENSCADIHISKDGKYLYGSNRGHNSIAIFAVADDGKLEGLGTVSVKGDWPRNFTLSPDGNFLLVANQRSNNIVVFNVNQDTGMLTPNGNEISIDSPVCLKFY